MQGIISEKLLINKVRLKKRYCALRKGKENCKSRKKEDEIACKTIVETIEKMEYNLKQEEEVNFHS